MSFARLRISCSQINEFLNEVTEDRWDFDKKQAVSIVVFRGACLPFDTEIGQHIDTYCEDGVLKEVTYAGNGTVNVNETSNSSSCCSLSALATIEDGTNPNTKKLVITITGTNPSFEINTGGGFVPINNQSTNRHIIDNIGNGTFTYSWTVRDASGCTFDGSTVVNNQPVQCTLFVTASSVNASFGVSDGQIFAAGNNGTPPYEYSLNGITFQSSGNFTNLIPNVYFVTVRDSNNCEEIRRVVVEENAGQPPANFPVDLIISPIIPYRFINLNSQGVLYDNELFTDEELYGSKKTCFEQLLNNSDIITIQLFYQEKTYNTFPKLIIRDAITNADITEIEFLNIGEGFYQIESTVPPEIQNRSVYFVIVSTDGTNNLQVVARSEYIKVEDREDSILIEYSNDSDYDDVRYAGNAYTNRLRIPIFNFWETTLGKESEVEKLSDRDLKLFQDTKKIRKLRVDFTPDYIHDKIELALSHDNIIIDNVRYVQKAEYDYGAYKIAQRLKTASVDLEDQNFIKSNVIT